MRQNQRGSILDYPHTLRITIVGVWLLSGVTLGEDSGVPQDRLSALSGLVSRSLSPDSWQATTESGYTIKLVAIWKGNQEGFDWWRPDGSRFSVNPAFHLDQPYIGWKGVVTQILPAENVSSKWKASVSGQTERGKVQDGSGDDIPGMESVAFFLHDEPDTITARCGLASGPWTTRTTCTQDIMKCLSARGYKDGGVMFTCPYDSEEGVVFVLVHSFSEAEIRTVAMGRDGVTYEPKQSREIGLGTNRLLEYTFGGTLDSIQEFRFQTRDYEWIEFSDIPLHPGKGIITKVLDHGSQKDAAHEEPKTRTVSLAKESRAKSRPLLGEAAPLFVADGIGGEDVRLGDYSGDVVLLDFWAMFCGPCIKSMPKIQSLHKKYRDMGLRVIGLHLANGAEGAEALLNRQGITFPTAVVNEETELAYAISVVPTYVLLDRKGRVVLFSEGRMPSEQVIVGLLQENDPK